MTVPETASNLLIMLWLLALALFIGGRKRAGDVLFILLYTAFVAAAVYASSLT